MEIFFSGKINSYKEIRHSYGELNFVQIISLQIECKYFHLN